MNSPQFPIGPLQMPATIEAHHISEAIEVLRVFPSELYALTKDLTDAVLGQPYRDGSWTIRQLVHHIADSHNHCYNRIRWTLTEDGPVIKAYDQDAFAAMQDYETMPVSWSLKHIEVLHYKLVYLFKSLNNEDWNRYFIHPETNKKVTIAQMVLTYAWHSKHHLAHINNGLK